MTGERWTVADMLLALKRQPQGRVIMIEGAEGRMDDIGSLHYGKVVDLGEEVKTENPWLGRYEEDSDFQEDRPKIEAVLLRRSGQ